jgi:hypothetical protein
MTTPNAAAALIYMSSGVSWEMAVEMAAESKGASPMFQQTEPVCSYCGTSLVERIVVLSPDGDLCSDCADDGGLPDWDDSIDSAIDDEAD